MIEIQLQKVAKRLGKTISDIARETGINRNTVTALYHGKVDGIRFSTLEKLCATYQLSLDDLLIRLQTKQNAKDVPAKLYRQEGEVALFTCSPPMLVAGGERLPAAFLGETFHGLTVYYQKEYGYWYWYADALGSMAAALYHRYSTPRAFEKFYFQFLKYADDLERLYRDAYHRSFSNDTNDELLDAFVRLRSIYQKFWEYSLFIDSFDAGFDTAEIQSIAHHHHFSVDEIAELTAPEDRTFSNDRILALLEILRPLLRKNIPRKSLPSTVRIWLKNHQGFATYQENFDYVESSYVHIKHLSLDATVADAVRYLSDRALFAKEWISLKKYSAIRRQTIQKILRKHGLKENPLFFFNKLTYWREYRKKVNIMGVHVMNMLLDVIEARTGISKKYLLFLTFDEFGSVLHGLVTKEILQQRYEKGILLTLQNGQYTMVVGDEARSLRTDLEKSLSNTDTGDGTTLFGQVACQGYAQGIARVVLNQADFHKFREGEILVTGMTRPEFVPVMKQAAAIVTNEGGITSHAAIVSRELGKPCIIGTKIATDMIHTGDLIEVRAHHGTVRILKKADRAKHSA